MKKKLLLAIGGFVALFLGNIVATQAQNAEKHIVVEFEQEVMITKPNEVGINALALLGLSFEGNYERLLAPDFSVGGRLSVSFGEGYGISRGEASLHPFARWFFNGTSRSQRKVASGWFLELGLPISHYKEEKNKYDNTTTPASTLFGISVGSGWKYVSQTGWTAELGGYLIRNLGGFGGDAHSFSGGYLLTIGRRF